MPLDSTGSTPPSLAIADLDPALSSSLRAGVVGERQAVVFSKHSACAANEELVDTRGVPLIWMYVECNRDATDSYSEWKIMDPYYEQYGTAKPLTGRCESNANLKCIVFDDTYNVPFLSSFVYLTRSSTPITRAGSAAPAQCRFGMTLLQNGTPSSTANVQCDMDTANPRSGMRVIAPEVTTDVYTCDSRGCVAEDETGYFGINSAAGSGSEVPVLFYHDFEVVISEGTTLDDMRVRCPEGSTLRRVGAPHTIITERVEGASLTCTGDRLIPSAGYDDFFCLSECAAGITLAEAGFMTYRIFSSTNMPVGSKLEDTRLGCQDGYYAWDTATNAPAIADATCGFPGTWTITTSTGTVECRPYSCPSTLPPIITTSDGDSIDIIPPTPFDPTATPIIVPGTCTDSNMDLHELSATEEASSSTIVSEVRVICNLPSDDGSGNPFDRPVNLAE